MKLPTLTLITILLAPPTIHAQSAGPDAAAQFEMGRALLHGNGVKKDVKKAFELMKASADKGNADAMGGVGYFYSNGIAVKRDDKEAVVWFRKGAEKGSPKAMLNLAKMLLAGKGVEGGDPTKHTEEGLQWMAKAAATGLPEAHLAYGSLFYLGEHGVAKDDAKALTFLKPAADHGMPEAQNMLGIMTETGQGVPTDEGAAMGWFRKAAMAGNAKAQSNLGRMLEPLNDDRLNRIEAITWLIIASGQGEVTASKQIEESMAGFKPGEFEEARQRAVELRKKLPPK